ncbi:MAG: hypothetical protein A07HB70_01862 [uncultured archaeon A07HB70]|nr:MAG: hypothetical protein A07HB70_01862 [uncultured archaeon A07HB70]
MAGDDAATLRALVARRRDLLAAAGTDVVDKRDLTETLDVSRSTVDRGVRELERAGLAERVDGGVRRTLPGTLALREHERTNRRLAAVADASTVLSALPNDADVDSAVLVGASVVSPTPDSPYASLGYQRGVIERADAVRASTSAVIGPQVDLYYEQIVEDGLELTVVVSGGVLNRILSGHRDQLREALGTGRVDIYRTDDPLPYGLAVTQTETGGEMFVTVYDDDGIVGTVGNDSAEAVAWARRTADDQLADAEPVSRP